MKKETYFKGKIIQIDNSLYTKEKKEIIYRLINFSNIFFFAEEISTGCIFPIYCFSSHNQKTNMGFRQYSYLSNGKYFVFNPISKSENIFEYKMDESHLKPNSAEVAGRKEVRKYLRSKRNDDSWKKELEEMETQNNYMCDLSVLKEKIKALKEGQNILGITPGSLEGTYETYTPSIDLKEISDFGCNLSDEENLCNLIGREEEKKKIIKGVCINKDSVLLVGSQDTGKTSIVEGLASDIKNNTNEWLKDKVIFKLDISTIEDGNNSYSSLKEKIKKLIDYCQKHEDKIIIFIDDIKVSETSHSKNKKLDILNILKPHISTGDITIIGTILKIEYEIYSKNDPAFMKKFDVIEVPSTTLEMNIAIILSYLKSLEKKHNIKLELEEQERYNLVQYITTLSDYSAQKETHISITTAKNIIKDAFAEAIYNKKKSVTLEDIYFGVLSCNKLSGEFRKEKAEELKRNIVNIKNAEDETQTKPSTLVRTIN